MSDRNLISAFVVSIVSLVIFMIGLQKQEIIGFESRFFLFAQEMWRNGISVFPTTYNQPYPDYTAASTIIIVFVAKLFGGLNKFTAVLPTAIAAGLTTGITYLIGSLQNRRIAICSVLFLLLTFSFFKNARSISLDLYPTLFCAICFYLTCSADIMRKRHRGYWTYLVLVLGFIFRGPIGLVMPTGIVIAYYAIGQQWRKLLNFGLLAFALLLISSFVLLYLARASYGASFMHDALRMQVLGRLENHVRPFYFYFVNSLATYALTYPLTILLLIGIYFENQKTFNKNFLLKLTGWVAVIMLGMSLAGDKKTRYILPIAPALALISAHLVLQFSSKYMRNLQRVFLTLGFLAPIIFIVLLQLLVVFARKNNAELAIPYLPLTIVLMLLQASNFAFMYLRKNLSQQIIAILFSLTIAFISIYVFAVEKLILYLERGRDFVTAIEQMRFRDHAALLFYKEQPDGFAIKYVIDMPRTTTPIFINNVHEIDKYMPAYVVTRETNFLRLPYAIQQHMRIIASDRMAHVRVVVFTKK